MTTMSRPHPKAVEAASLASAREYWTGILVGYVAAVLTSVGIMLAFVRHGWE
jgi:hypothetical protein